ncbi:MAG: ATPase, partial [Anaerolineae bacterium]|nr:ATPase [Anaerolineae bacterium]
LLVVDQRPSGIDQEVMSQIGTRITARLDEENDIRAVFSGVSGTAALREVLARLETKQQALILGHAVPMPIVIRTRDYRDFVREIAGNAIDVEDASTALFA